MLILIKLWKTIACILNKNNVALQSIVKMQVMVIHTFINTNIRKMMHEIHIVQIHCLHSHHSVMILVP